MLPLSIPKVIMLNIPENLEKQRRPHYYPPKNDQSSLEAVKLFKVELL
jgi:hypothetical protein